MEPDQAAPGRETVHRINPYAHSDPARVRGMFFGRKRELNQLRTFLFGDDPKPVYVRGPRGIGKTAFVRWAMKQDPMAEGAAVRIDCRSIVSRLTSQTDVDALTAEIAEPNPLFIWLDNVHELRAAEAFGRLDRSGLSHLEDLCRPPARLILSGRGRLRRPLETVFSPVHFRLPPLSEKDTYDMIAKPLKGRLRFEDARTILKVHRLSGGHPDLIRGICKAVVDRARDRRADVVAPRDLGAVLSEMVRAEKESLPDLWDDLPDGARRAAVTLADLLADESAFAPERQLLDAVNRAWPGMTETDVRHAVGFLRRDMLLLETMRQGDGIRFKADLFRHWLSVQNPDPAGEAAKGEGESAVAAAGPPRRRFSRRLAWSVAALAGVSAAVLAAPMAFNRNSGDAGPTSPALPVVSAPIAVEPPADPTPGAETLASVTNTRAPGPIPRPSGMVRIGRFYIDRTEVSIRDYAQVFPDYTPPKAAFTGDMPAVNISHADARAYAAKTGKRLCTPAEWRTALGPSPAVDEGVLHFGATDIPYGVDEESEAHPNGLCHMTGNVSEWVALDGAADPAYIGGNWCLNLFENVSADAILKVRRADDNGAGAVTIGFRCCMDAEG